MITYPIKIVRNKQKDQKENYQKNLVGFMPEEYRKGSDANRKFSVKEIEIKAKEPDSKPAVQNDKKQHYNYKIPSLDIELEDKVQEKTFKTQFQYKSAVQKKNKDFGYLILRKKDEKDYTIEFSNSAANFVLKQNEEKPLDNIALKSLLEGMDGKIKRNKNKINAKQNLKQISNFTKQKKKNNNQNEVKKDQQNNEESSDSDDDNNLNKKGAKNKLKRKNSDSNNISDSVESILNDYKPKKVKQDMKSEQNSEINDSF